MKKLFAILMAWVMIFCLFPANAFARQALTSPAQGYAEYDGQRIAQGDGEYIDSLSYDQLASFLLDYIDGEIAKSAADFDAFEAQVLGKQVSVDIAVGGLDDLVSYAPYFSQLGGDFAKLDPSALYGLKRADGDINFIYGIISFAAANSDILGKIFAWEDSGRFDFGAVDEYIKALPQDNSIRLFYENFILDNNMQEKLVDGIAQLLGYTVKRDENGNRLETVDEIVNNGILSLVVGAFKDGGLLSEQAAQKMLDTYDLRATDAYMLVKSFVCDIQADNEVRANTYYTFYLDTYIRTMLKAMFGFKPEIGAVSADSKAVSAEFKGVYKDLTLLGEISGGTVFYRAQSGKYYCVTLSGGDIASIKDLTWVNGMDLILEQPVANIYTKGNETVINGYGCSLVKSYSPSKEPTVTVYSDFSQVLEGSDPTGTISFKSEAAPQDVIDVMTQDNYCPMQELVAVTVDSGETNLLTAVVTFDELEAYAEKSALEAARQAIASMGLNLTVESVDVTLSYKGYAAQDKFVVAVSADASVKIANLPSFLQSTVDSAVKQALSTVISDPAAVLVIDGLESDPNFAGAAALFDYVNTDFDIDRSVIDFAGNYDEYNGVVGQVNRVLCDVVKMIVSPEGYAELGLTQGSNENLTANLEKICKHTDELLKITKLFMDEQGFADFIKSSGVDDFFASSHGLNASMIYNLDFSSVENLYVCGIEMLFDFIDDEQPGIVNDIHEAIEGLETLDAVTVALADVALSKLVEKANAELDNFSYSYVPTDAGTVQDKQGGDILMAKAVDLLYYTADWSFDNVINKTVNEFIDSVNSQCNENIPHVAFKLKAEKGNSRQETLNAPVDRFCELTDGIIVAVDTISPDDNVYDKLSTIANAVLPMGTFFSNCKSDKFTCDLGMILNEFVFDEALDGNMDNLLRLFETKVKTDDAAQGNSVTFAMIRLAEHMANSVLPGAVSADNYKQSKTVLEEFNSSKNAALIGSSAIKAVDGRKQYLVPAVLDLIRESGVLSALTACSHDGETETVPAVSATCTKGGRTEGVRCKQCSAIISGCEKTAADPANHTSLVAVPEEQATCTQSGFTAGVMCADCGKYVSGHEVIPTAEHADNDGDGACDTCGEVLEVKDPPKAPTFFERIQAFFASIGDWFKGIFKK